MFDLAGLQANVPLPLPLLLPLLLQHDPDRANGVIESADAGDGTLRIAGRLFSGAEPEAAPRRAAPALRQPARHASRGAARERGGEAYGRRARYTRCLASARIQRLCAGQTATSATAAVLVSHHGSQSTTTASTATSPSASTANKTFAAQSSSLTMPQSVPPGQ